MIAAVGEDPELCGFEGVALLVNCPAGGVVVGDDCSRCTPPDCGSGRWAWCISSNYPTQLVSFPRCGLPHIVAGSPVNLKPHYRILEAFLQLAKEECITSLV